MRVKIVLAALLLIAVAASSASAQVTYDRKNGRLTAVYQGAPLRDVLSEISSATGIVVYVDPGVDKVVFIDSHKRPVDEVLNDIITPLNCMLQYRGNTVTAVRIYEQMPSDATQRIGAGVPPKPSASVANSGRAEQGRPPAAVERVAPQSGHMDRTQALQEELKELNERNLQRARRQQAAREKRERIKRLREEE